MAASADTAPTGLRRAPVMRPSPAVRLPAAPPRDRDAPGLGLAADRSPQAWSLLGRRIRRRLAAIERFGRMLDAARGDAEADRIAADLERVAAGAEARHPAVREVADCSLPPAPLHRLLAVARSLPAAPPQTFDDLLERSRRATEPVGELVLDVLGAASPDRIDRLSIITAARRIAIRLGDVAGDHGRGRVHLPAEDMRLVGLKESDLTGLRAGAGLRALLALEVERTRLLLDSGAALARELPRRPRVAVAGLVADGRARLDALDAADYDVLGGRLRPGGWAQARGLADAVRGR